MIRYLCIQSFFFFEDRYSSIAIENASEPGDAYNAWSRDAEIGNLRLSEFRTNIKKQSQAEALAEFDSALLFGV